MYVLLTIQRLQYLVFHCKRKQEVQSLVATFQPFVESKTRFYISVI